MLPLEDSRLLKPAKSSVAAHSPLQTKPPSSSRVHSSSPPSSAYQAFRQGERESLPAKPKFSVHPHLPSGHISSPPRPVAAARQPSAPPRIYPANFIGPIAPGATRQSSPSKTAPVPARNLPTAHHTSSSANAAERHDPDFNVVSDVTKGIAIGTRKPSPPNSSVSHHPPAPHQPYGYDEMRVKSDPTKRTNSNQRTKIWNSMADDPKAPLTEVQREQIRATGRTKPWHNPITGKLESMELSHEPTPHKSGGTTVTPRWPEDHAARDPHRHLSRPVREAYQNHGNAIRDSFAKEVVHKEWGYTIHPEETRIKSPKLGASRVTRALQNTPVAQSIENSRISQSVERGLAKGPLRIAGRAALPLAAAVDAYDLTKTYQQDGFGPKFRSEAAGVAGGWGTAFAAGAAGTAICGPLCGIAAGAGGYLVGSGAASKLEEGAEELGKGAVEEGKKLWHKVFG